MTVSRSHLDALEASSIHILREVVAGFARPVLLYSIGKDSSVLLHLARKAFHPGRIPFPVLHVDTLWKFQDMIRFRDATAAKLGLDLRLHTNEEAVAAGVTPFTATSVVYNDLMKTQGLRQALARWSFDAAIGGARRDEEKSRAKERIFSIRSASHRWSPKAQRPELWSLYNTRLGEGETMRVFPLSNWTERDVWHYIYREQIEIVPLYFARPRKIVHRKGAMILVDDHRIPIGPTDQVETRWVRFRSIGCYPYTGAIDSRAETLPEILMEMETSRTSERQGRLIDTDQVGSMEKKKQEGYF
jgi:sulfate adenylyltransferase subunit 2